MAPSRGRPDTATVWVTGMHRSGTSLAMRVLHLLGVELGDESHLLPPGPDNRAGYWENQLVKELDDELLAELGGSWDQPPVLAPGWQEDPALDPWRDRAATVLDGSYRHGSTLVGIKDPRASLLLPFWATVTDVAATVVLVRDPREVADSLALRRVDVARPQAALLWLRYLFAATANDPDHLLITHDALVDDIDATMARLAGHLDLAPPSADRSAAAHEHLDPSLRHHRAGAVDSTGEDDDAHPLMDMALEVWNDGDPRLDALGTTVTDALRSGWLRAPSGSDALTRARADAVRFKEHLRARNERVRQLTAALDAAGTAPT